MVKKVFSFVAAVAVTLSSVALFGLGSVDVSAQGLAPDPNAPNCYNVAGNAYQKVDCDITAAYLTTPPMAPGLCYIPTSGFPPTYLVKDCAAIAQNPGNSPATPTPVTTTSRDDAIKCDGTNASGAVDQAKLQDCLKANPLIARFNEFINFLSIGVGVVVTIVIIIGGIQYASAGGNPQAVSAAKKRILNAMIALVAYFLVYSLLQWLVPGGVF